MQSVEPELLFLPRLKTQPEASPAFVSKGISFHLEAKLIGGVSLILSMNMQVLPAHPNHIFSHRPQGWEERVAFERKTEQSLCAKPAKFDFFFFFPPQVFEQA